MKRLTALFLVFLLLPAVAPAEEPAKAVQGFIVDNDAFFMLEERFLQKDFSGSMGSVELSETQLLVFNPEPIERLLPNLAVTLTNADPLTEDSEALATTLGSLIQAMQYLQGQYPDVFVFNNEIAAAYDEAGLSYLVAEPELWLWPETGNAVFVPVCFYESASGALIDGMYLMEVMAAEDGALCYLLYNDPEHVASYLEHVKINADDSSFQYALALWYVQNYLMNQKIAFEDDAVGAVCVVNNVCHVRVSSDAASNIVARVGRGEWYPVLSVAENGWYQIRLGDGRIGYISPMLVDFYGRDDE